MRGGEEGGYPWSLCRTPVTKPFRLACATGRGRVTESATPVRSRLLLIIQKTTAVRSDPKCGNHFTYIWLVLNEKITSVCTDSLVFPENISRKTQKNQCRKNLPLNFWKKTKFRYKGVEDRAVAPLELCQHSRAHKTEQGRSQGYWQVMTTSWASHDQLFSSSVHTS